MTEDGTSKSLGTLQGTVEHSAHHERADGPHGADWNEAFQWDSREDCEVRQILDRIADKWSLLVIALLDDRTLRFTELRRLIDGVSQRMLTVTLRQLERDGMVRRTVHPVVPPRVDYALTEMGRSLHATVQALVVWTERHQEDIIGARDRYDRALEPVDVAPAAMSVGRGTLVAQHNM